LSIRPCEAKRDVASFRFAQSREISRFHPHRRRIALSPLGFDALGAHSHTGATQIFSEK
jgi:hypothetical protein